MKRIVCLVALTILASLGWTEKANAWIYPSGGIFYAPPVYYGGMVVPAHYYTAPTFYYPSAPAYFPAAFVPQAYFSPVYYYYPTPYTGYVLNGYYYYGYYYAPRY